MNRKSIYNPKLAAAISLLLALVFFLPSPLFAVDFVAGDNQDAGMQKTVFTAIDKVSLKPAPQLKADPNDVELPLGQPLTVTETKEEWLHVKTVNTGNNGSKQHSLHHPGRRKSYFQCCNYFRVNEDILQSEASHSRRRQLHLFLQAGCGQIPAVRRH